MYHTEYATDICQSDLCLLIKTCFPFFKGFDGTSNLLAGKMFGIPVKGTHAHAFVTSFINLLDVKTRVCDA